MTVDELCPSPLEREAADPDTPAERLELLANDHSLQPAVAANPATPPAALKRLRLLRSRAIRAALASNPNSPIEVLFELAGDFPVEVLDNPVLPILMLANPELPERMVHELREDTLCALLRCEQLPRAILKLLASSSHQSVRALAAQHVELAGEPGPGDLLRAQSAARAALAQVPIDKPKAVFELPGLLAPWFVELLLDTPFAELISRCPDTPSELLMRLALTGDLRMLVVIAAHPNTPAKLLTRLALHSAAEVRVAVAGNPATPGRVLSDLADSSRDAIRKTVAAHPAASAATLAELARDHSPQVRAAVASNPNTPLELLRRLGAAAEPEVRGAAQRHMPLRPELLAYFSDDPDPLRRCTVAAHPDTSLETLMRLGLDRDIRVRVNVARHPRASSFLLGQLSRDSESRVRSAVAMHPRLPPELRRRLELDRDPDVRAHLAHNPHAPFLTLKRLWKNASQDLLPTRASKDEVRAQASGKQLRLIARHPAVSLARRSKLYAQLFAGPLRRLREDPSLLRLAALASDVLTESSYEAGSASRHWLDRYIVASNPAAPLAVVAALAHDGIVFIRAAAQANLAARPAADSSAALHASEEAL